MRNNTSTARLVSFARSAGALDAIAFGATDRTPERATAFAKLLAACAANVPPVDPATIYASASVADAVVRQPRAKPAAKPADENVDAAKRANAETASKPGNAAKPDKPASDAKPEAEPVKPSKPADTAKAADYAERVRIIGELRASVASLYNGPSLAIRTNPKRFAHAVYAELLACPKHRTDLARISIRDESGIREMLRASDAAGTFDPSAINIDAGIFSRLCSVGFVIGADGARFALSDPGLAHAGSVAKRAA